MKCIKCEKPISKADVYKIDLENNNLICKNCVQLELLNKLK
jgi:hypothetical protein